MAHKYREEIVGKRFLSVSSGFTKLKGKIRDWNWRAGVIRAATHRDNKNQDIQVLVEYDDVEWQRREWISIYRDNLFHLFLVEQGLVWADRRDPFRPTSGSVIWPALTFTPLVSNLGIPNNLKPIEFLLDRELAFKEYRSLKPYQEWDTTLRGLRDYPELRLAVKRWSELQDGQRILLTTPSVLVGYRVEVYRAEGTTQWYTAVIIGYNEATRDLTVTDDTVLEEHNEDPSLIQMRIIGDGVVESIMRGEVVGITPRRSRSSALLHQQNTQLLQNRVIRGTIGRTRQSRLEISDSGISQELANKGKSKKRKPNETYPPTSRARPHHIKEDLENKQTRRKNLNNRSNNKKKVLEEANNSKLREVEIIVEDCLQNGSLFGSQTSPHTSSHGSQSPQNSENEDVTPEDENVELDKTDQLDPTENSPETPPPCLEKEIEDSSSPPPALENEEDNKETDKEQDRSIEGLEKDNTNSSSDLLVNDNIPELVSEEVEANTIKKDSELVKNLTNNVQSELSDIEDNLNSENESLRRSSSGSMSDESRRIVKQVVENILLNSDGESDSQFSDTVNRLREKTKENSDTSSDLNRINNPSNGDLIKEEKVSEIEDENSRNSLTNVSTKASGASVEEEEDCVVVSSDKKSSDLSVIRETNVIQATSTPVKERPADLDISIRDDEGPLSSSSPFSVSSRMDLDSSLTGPASLMRHSNSFIQADNSDNRSDSGVSSLRSASSGDERSGSRSSALSSTDEPPTSNSSSGGTIQPATRSPLFIPSARSEHLDRVSNSTTQDPVRVWRDPSLLLEEPHIRHVHSIQHHPLLMSHPGAQQAPTGSTAPQQQPNNQQQHQQQATQQPTSSSNNDHQRQPPVVSHPASIYPPVPPPSSLMAPHPLGPHHPPLPPHLYHPGFQDILWKQRYAGVPAHLLQHATGQVSEEQLLDRDRERVFLQDRENTERIMRQREELEKQKRLKERELEKEREKQELEREREREEKERQAQALQIHFEKSLAKAQQKRASELYLSTRPPQSRTSSISEEDRKQELHQRERERDQQRHLAAVRANEANHRSYYSPVPSKPINVKSEYPPPPAHSSRIPTNHQQQQQQQAASLAKQQAEKMSNLTHQAVIMQKNADLAMYGYQVAHAQNAYYEQKKAEFQHSKGSSGLVVTKTGQLERDLPNPPPLVSEMKNSVIVKHDTGKVGHHLEPRVSIALSPSPKLRNDMMGHYMQASAGQYRSPNQSPHHLPPHAASPHHLEAAQKSAAQSQHRQVSNQHPSPHSQHHPSQHHSRQSPHNQPQHHPHSQQHLSPELRFREQAMIYPAGKPGYPSYLSTTAMSGYTTTTSLSNSKPKVSSPAPHQFYGKPTSGVVSVVPVSRPNESPMPLNRPPIGSTVSSSPYQQVSLHHPPPGAMTGAPSTVTCPPPAHSSKVSTAPLDRYPDPRYQPGSIPPGSGLSVKLLNQPGASPPIASSVPLPRGQPSFSISPSLQQGAGQVQTQPLDLGVSSNRQEPGSFSPKRKSSTPSLGSPVSLEIKKRRVELCPTPPGGVGTAPSPLGAMRMSPGPLGAAPGSIGPMGVPSATNLSQSQPQLARVSEPSPLIANAATTITTLVNTAAYRGTPVSLTSTQSPTNLTNQSPAILTENLPDLSVTAVSIDGATPLLPRPASTDSTHSIPPKSVTPVGGAVPPSSSPAPPVTASNTGVPTPPACSTPGPSSTAEQEQATPQKSSTPAPQPSSLDSEKSNSPGPQPNKGGGASAAGGASYPVRHLKKAWLQRHTGEDIEDTTGVIGTGSSVSLPLHINRPSPPPVMNSNNAKSENPVNSIHSVGSMAVNSINKSKHFQNKALNRKTAKESSNVNGHPSDNSKGGDDSSSSDQERGGRKSPPKRKPPKVKRKKGGGPLGKKAIDEKKRKGDTKPSNLPSESGSDSDKESGSEKDSDSGASTVVSNNGGSSGGNGKTKGGPNREPRKRGRRPKGSKNDKGEEPRAKKSKDNEDNEPQRDPFRKPPVGQLKKTGESFLQDGPCFEVAPKLQKCRECRWTPNQRSRNMPNIFCRFYAFRRLRYTKNGQLAIAGFSDPHKDALEEDIKLWLPNTEDPPNDLDLETSRFLLKQVGDHFCDLLLQEKEANNEHMSEDKTVAWKRVVQGVREMCDVCETTLFNYHWACGKCGFVVCLDCYKSRKNNSKSQSEQKDRDEFNWLLCTNRGSHEQEKLMLTQIIADDCLLKLGRMVHEMRDIWGIEQYCGCPTQKDTKLNHTECKEVVKMILAEKMNGIKEEKDEKPKLANGAVKDEKNSPLNWLADVAIKNEEKPDSEASNNKEKPKQGSHEGSSSEDEGNFSTLRELLIRPSHKANGSSRAASPVSKDKDNKKKSNSEQDPLAFAMDSPLKVEKEDAEEKMELKHFVRRYNWQNKGRQQLPIRIMTLTESKILYPNTPHSWLCDGKLLRLSDALCKENYKIFQDQWKRGQPVIVSDVTKNINKDLWNPDAFARDFGDEKNDLINCMTGNLVPNQPMRKFWEGFDHFSKRLRDDKGQPMLLKLKDWPPGEDFAEMLPSRFADLMKVLPLEEYTHRSGRLNLASRLPECFVRPDLGPKMYNAYGSALHPNKGTTNLHLDISDAVNVMVYVGIPKDGDNDEHIREAFKAIDEAGCDILTRRRVRDKGELPGALWHIYNARDADKIRDLLNKVTVEKGGRLEPQHDPIHDQSGYLDGPLRERLYKEYGVEGYAIVQCYGDAVFIPAGAPHQVRNLHNCIKVAEDFVSPENVSHCFHLTQEFRDLSDTHTNHEDKLQIKNIIYHAVKDALSTLGALMNKQSGKNVVTCDVSVEKKIKEDKD